MTKREFLNMVIEDTANEEIKAFAIEEIEKMDKKNASRSSKMTKTQLENVGIKQNIVDYLGEHDFVPASEIADKLGLSTSKVASLLSQLIKENYPIIKDTRKVEGRKDKTTCYKLVEKTEETEN